MSTSGAAARPQGDEKEQNVGGGFHTPPPAVAKGQKRPGGHGDRFRAQKVRRTSSGAVRIIDGGVRPTKREFRRMEDRTEALCAMNAQLRAENAQLRARNTAAEQESAELRARNAELRARNAKQEEETRRARAQEAKTHAQLQHEQRFAEELHRQLGTRIESLQAERAQEHGKRIQEQNRHVQEYGHLTELCRQLKAQGDQKYEEARVCDQDYKESIQQMNAQLEREREEHQQALAEAEQALASMQKSTQKHVEGLTRNVIDAQRSLQQARRVHLPGGLPVNGKIPLPRWGGDDLGDDTDDDTDDDDTDDDDMDDDDMDDDDDDKYRNEYNSDGELVVVGATQPSDDDDDDDDDDDEEETKPAEQPERVEDAVPKTPLRTQTQPDIFSGLSPIVKEVAAASSPSR
jgi:hypothetical protein